VHCAVAVVLLGLETQSVWRMGYLR
jgi:hypothetical protein